MAIKQYLKRFLGLLADIALLPVRGNIFPRNRDSSGDWSGPERRTRRNFHLAPRKEGMAKGGRG